MDEFSELRKDLAERRRRRLLDPTIISKAPVRADCLNRDQTPDEIRAEARLIAQKRGYPEFAAACEWPRFAKWFVELGRTERRWWNDWPKWLKHHIGHLEGTSREHNTSSNGQALYG